MRKLNDVNIDVFIHVILLFYLGVLFLGCSVFWDLYCAAPERRETCEHSSEAKAFQDYVSVPHRSQCVVREHGA